MGDEEKSLDIKSRYLKHDYKPEEQNEVDILRKRYDEYIMYCDMLFNSFLDNLSEKIDMSNTIIIFSSDHGENFSHGNNGHRGEFLYEPVISIPLVIKIPGNKKGQKIDFPVEQIDIAPTILEFAGISVPEWMDGRSLVPLLKGESMEYRPIYASYLQKNYSFEQPITKGVIAVRDVDYKLIYYLEQEESLLFDLKNDPYETQNITGSEPEIKERLKKLITDNVLRINNK